MNGQRTISNPNAGLIAGGAIVIAILYVIVAVGFLIGGEIRTYALIAGMFQFGFLVVLIVLAVSGSNAVAEIKSLLTGAGVLVYWKYSPAEWQQYVDKEYLRLRSNARITGGAFVAVGLIAGWIGLGDMTWIGGLMLGLFLGAIGFVLAQAHAVMTRKNNRSQPGDVFIGVNGIYIGSAYHGWTGRNAHFGSVTLQEPKPGESAELKFIIHVAGRHSVQDREVFIPVPEGRLDEAKRLAEELTNRFAVRNN